jgi:hypothetical protein
MKIFAIGVSLVVAVLALNPIVHYTTLDTARNVRILDKERVTVSANDGVVTSKYLIFAQGETFENTDTIWAMKYNSSDIYGYIQKNLSCTFEVTGFRVPFLSMYRNILSAKCEFPAV